MAQLPCRHAPRRLVLDVGNGGFEEVRRRHKVLGRVKDDLVAEVNLARPRVVGVDARDALDRRLAGLPAEDRVRLHAFGQRLQAIGDEAGSPRRRVPISPRSSPATVAAISGS